jgi:integrase
MPMSLYAPSVPQIPSGVLTVRQIVDIYLANEAKSYCPEALIERRRVLDEFCAALGDRPLPSCRPVDLVVYVNAHADVWKSDWTIRGKVNILQRPFNWAAGLRLIDDNPFHGITHCEGEPFRPMRPDEFRRMLKGTDAMFRRVLTFQRFTGLRPCEMSRLTWEMVDLEEGVIVIPRKQHKTGKKTRKAKVTPLVLTAWKLMLWLQRETGQEHPSGRVFGTRRGTAWNRSNLSLRIQRLRERCGIPEDCKLYGLRHALGTDACANGGAVKLVSKGMGHKTSATTEKHYVQLDPEIEAVRGAMEMAFRKKQPRAKKPMVPRIAKPAKDISLPLFDALLAGEENTPV